MARAVSAGLCRIRLLRRNTETAFGVKVTGMHIRTIYKFTLPSLMITALTACGTPSVPGATSPVPTQSNTANLCANPLVPITSGATWNYATSGMSATPFGFSSTISDVRADGFTATLHLADNVNIDEEWACKPEGLLALSIGSAQAGLALAMEGINANVQTSDVTGITLPSNPQPGQTWTYGLKIAGDITQASVTAQLTGDATSTMQVVGTESVTVPAGTFNSTKISGSTAFNITAHYLGIGFPLSSTMNSTFWLAPGVGLVKSVQTGDLAGTSVNSTTELQSYTIP
jgi:hypothetical protein